MKIVILGASGFIGSHVAEQCALSHQLSGEDITCIVRGSSSTAFLQTLDVTLVESDFSLESLIDCMRGSDVVINCVALPELHADPQRHREVDVVLTGRIFRAADTARVGRFIQLSTVQVYGFKRPPVPVNEDYPMGGDYLFNRIAIERETYLRTLAAGTSMELVIARPSNTVGARDPNFLEVIKAHRQGFVPQFNKGVSFSCVDTRDVGRAMLLLAQKHELQHSCYLIKGFDIAWAEVKELLDGITGRQSRILYMPEKLMLPIAWLMEKLFPYGSHPPLIPFSVKVLATNTLFDDSRMRAEGYKPQHDARDMLETYLQSLKTVKTEGRNHGS